MISRKIGHYHSGRFIALGVEKNEKENFNRQDILIGNYSMIDDADDKYISLT